MGLEAPVNQNALRVASQIEKVTAWGYRTCHRMHNRKNIWGLYKAYYGMFKARTKGGERKGSRSYGNEHVWGSSKMRS